MIAEIAMPVSNSAPSLEPAVSNQNCQVGRMSWMVDVGPFMGVGYFAISTGIDQTVTGIEIGDEGVAG